MRTKTGVLTFTDLSQMEKMRRGSELGEFLDEMNVIRPEELIEELTTHFQKGSGNHSRFFMDYRYRDFASVSRVRRMMPVYGAKGLAPVISQGANFVELLLGKESDLAGTGFNENIFGISYLNGGDTVTMSDRELEMEIGRVGITSPLRVSPENVDKLSRTLCRLWEAQEKDPSTRFVILTGRAGERSVEIIRQLYMLLPDRLRLQLGFETNVAEADIDRIQSARLPIYVMTAEPGQDFTSRKWAFPLVLCEWERTEQYPCDEGRLALVRKLAENMDEDLLTALGKAERTILYRKEADVSSFKYYETILRRLFAGSEAERTAAPTRVEMNTGAQGAEEVISRRPDAAQARMEASADADEFPQEAAAEKRAKDGPEIMPWFQARVRGYEDKRPENRRRTTEKVRPAVERPAEKVKPAAERPAGEERTADEPRRTEPAGDPSHEVDPMTHLRRQNEALAAENEKLNKENVELRAQLRALSGEEQRLKANNKVLEDDKDTLGRSRNAAEREIRDLSGMNRKLKQENEELVKANMALGEKIRRLEKSAREQAGGKSGGGLDAAVREAAQGPEMMTEDGRMRPSYEQMERRTRQLFRKNRVLRKRVLLFGAVALFLFLLLLIALITLWMLLGQDKQEAGTSGPASTEAQTGPGLVSETGGTAVTPGQTTPGGTSPAESGQGQTSPAESGQGQTSPAESGSQTGPAGSSPSATGTADDWTAIGGGNPDSGLVWSETSDRLGEPVGYQVYYHIRFANDNAGAGLSEDTSLPYIGVYVNGKASDTDQVQYYQWQAVSGLNAANGIRADWIDVPGIDYYLHIAYAADQNGSDFSTTDPTGRGYVGYYISGHADGGVSPDSGNPGDYTWVSR